MTINVYYVPQGKKLILFAENIEDFNVLNKFLLTIQQLGKRVDEDVVPLKVIKSSLLEKQIIITSNFLFTKMPELSWSSCGSVEGMLQDNGFYLIPKVTAKPSRSSWENLASSFNTYSLRSLFYGYKGNKPSLSTDEVRSLIEENKENISEQELAEKYGVSVRTIQKITKHI
jgi:hypothetical protein